MIGVLVDQTATTAFADAVRMAGTQLNEGLARAGSRLRFDVKLVHAARAALRDG